MEALTEMYRRAYFTSLKQIIIDKAKAVIKTNSDLEQEYAELVAACTEFQQALGKEEVNADGWAQAIVSSVEKYGTNTETMSKALQTLCEIYPSEFTEL
jgi:hypothetical protein